jgi:hypothetical protein
MSPRTPAQFENKECAYQVAHKAPRFKTVLSSDPPADLDANLHCIQLSIKPLLTACGTEPALFTSCFCTFKTSAKGWLYL